MMTVRCYLAPSDIEGLGVFCRDDIAKGQRVWRHDDDLDLSFPESKLDHVEAHVREFIDRYAYPDRRRPGNLVLESDEGRFMNHSDSPNLDFSGEFGIALCDIPAGTELTCSYAEFCHGEIVMQPTRHAVGALVQTAA